MTANQHSQVQWCAACSVGDIALNGLAFEEKYSGQGSSVDECEMQWSHSVAVLCIDIRASAHQLVEHGNKYSFACVQSFP